MHAEIMDELGPPAVGAAPSATVESLMIEALNGSLLRETIAARLEPRVHSDDMRVQENGWRWYMRAYHLGLVSDGEQMDYPSDWDGLAREIRQRDGQCCQVCGAEHVELHVHHIVHLSCYGTNDPRNLVTLCHPCHQAQHPTHYFSIDPISEDPSQQGETP